MTELLLLLLLLLPPQSLVACFPGKLPSGCFPSLACTWTPLLEDSCQPLVNVSMEGRKTEIDITSCVQFKEADVLWTKICDGENTPVSTRAKNKNPLLVDITGLNISNKLYAMVETINGDSICYFNPLPKVDDRTVNSTSIVLVIITIFVIVIGIVVAIIFVLHKLERLPYCFYNLLNCCPDVIVREDANTENQDIELGNCSVENKDDTKEGKKEKKTDENNGIG